MEKRKGAKPPNDRAPEDTYRELLEAEDRDAVHEVIAAKGVEVLREDIPYIVKAARWRLASARRRQIRRGALSDRHKGESVVAQLDPYEAAAQNEVLRSLLDALSLLPDADLLVLWRAAEEVSDEDVAQELLSAGITKERPSVSAVRKRRQRARERLRRELGLSTKD